MELLAGSHQFLVLAQLLLLLLLLLWALQEGQTMQESLASPSQGSLRKLLWSQVSGCCRCREVWGWGMALRSICPPLIPRQTRLFHLCSRSRRAHHTSHLI